MKKLTCSFFKASFFRFTSNFNGAQSEIQTAKVKVDIDSSKPLKENRVDQQKENSVKIKVKKEKNTQSKAPIETADKSDVKNNVKNPSSPDKPDKPKKVKREKKIKSADPDSSKSTLKVKLEINPEITKKVVAEKPIISETQKIQITKRTAEFDYLCIEECIAIAIKSNKRQNRELITNEDIPKSKVEFVKEIIELAKKNNIPTSSIPSFKFKKIFSEISNKSVMLKCSKLDYSIIEDNENFIKSSSLQSKQDLIIVSNCITSQEIVALLFRSSLFYNASSFVVTNSKKPLIDTRFSIISGGSIELKSIHAASDIEGFLRTAQANGYKIIEVLFEEEQKSTEETMRNVISGTIPENLTESEKHIIVFSFDRKKEGKFMIKEVDFRIVVKPTEYYNYSIMTTVILNRITSKISSYRQNKVCNH